MEEGGDVFPSLLAFSAGKAKEAVYSFPKGPLTSSSFHDDDATCGDFLMLSFPAHTLTPLSLPLIYPLFILPAT